MAAVSDSRLSLEEALADADAEPKAATPEPPAETVQVSIAGPVHATALSVKAPDGSTIRVTRTAQHFAHEALDAIHDAARRCGVLLRIGN